MDVASLVSAWDALVLQLAATFTSPTAQTWRQIALGWVLHHKPAVTTGIIRNRRDAAIYALPRPRPQGQRGRPARKGKRLPTPRALARQRQEGWTTYVFQKQGHTVKRQVLGMTCLWYHVCQAVPIRMVIVRDPSGVQKDDFFFCTDATTPGAPDREIGQRYFDRWGVEESILEAKQLMGFENTRGWCSKTVNRQAPLAMVLTTLVKCWYARCAVKEPSLLPPVMPWHRRKTRPSFADMLSALRQVIWSHRISSNSCMSRQVQEIIKTVTYALSATT